MLQSMTIQERGNVNWWLVEYARDKQIPPPGDWFVWLIRSGRGFGKTRTGAEYVIHRAKNGYRNIAIVGQTKGDVRDTMVELGDSSILKVSPDSFRPNYEPSKRRLTWPNGAVGTIYSGDEPDQLRGPQHDTAWVDELAKYRYPQQTWDNLEFGLRLSADPRVVLTTTPRPISIIKELIADSDTVDVTGSSYENKANLSERYIARITKRYEGTRLGRQELHGQIIDDVPGALWGRELLDETRVSNHPDFFRVGVGVDPHVTTGETGIITAGIAKIGDDLHGYVLGDDTTGGTPATWATAGVAAYNKYNADIMIGEINNGGDMIENTIRNVDGGRQINYKTVRATRGKYVRAEPIAAIYEQGRCHHVGYYAELEDQQCSYVPGELSPNNLDALVWVLTELMLDTVVDWNTVSQLGTVENYSNKWT